jgi:hypothetical protein
LQLLLLAIAIALMLIAVAAAARAPIVSPRPILTTGTEALKGLRASGGEGPDKRHIPRLRQDRDQRVEVTIARGGEERIDDLTLSCEVGGAPESVQLRAACGTPTQPPST